MLLEGNASFCAPLWPLHAQERVESRDPGALIPRPVPTAVRLCGLTGLGRLPRLIHRPGERTVLVLPGLGKEVGGLRF